MDAQNRKGGSGIDRNGRIIYTSSTDKSVPLLPLEKAYFFSVACDLVLPPEKALLTMILGEECGRSKPLPYGVDVVLLNKCGKFVGSIHESTATDAKADDQWSSLRGRIR